MVESALQRAGVGHGGAATVKVPEAEVLSASDLPTPSVAPIPMVSSIPVHTASHEPVIAPFEQASFADEVPVPPRLAPVQIDSSSQPVAFGTLLAPPTDDNADDLGLPPPAHPASPP